jgi:hypothetical protein
LTSVVRPLTFHILINSSETTGPNGTKLGRKLAIQKQELPLAAIFVGGMGRNEETLERTLYRYFLPSLVPFGPVVSEELIKI